MNYVHLPEEHRWEVREPISRPGDYVELRAEMDVMVAISNGPQDVLNPCNDYNCTPMKIEVFEEE